ncbi:dTDP-4-dehydrorhamnose 3,5-epimerase family protein [Patescibacteria group bacterium]|nr:dTDP-4-dehydrorhamnose 3,5-epimerase family protein [Patescibacteria group bacterium]
MNVRQTEIAGLYLIDLDVHADDRGSFREAWQAEKMEQLGLPAFRPVQYNVAESRRGVTRGIHVEPWNKYIHLAAGKVFAAIVDTRQSEPTFGKVLTFELDCHRALFLSQGLGNSYQALTDQVVYTYLVTDHWRPNAGYAAIALDDPTLAIPWPLPREEWIVSEKDTNNPRFAII